MPRVAAMRRAIDRWRHEIEAYGPNGYREVALEKILREYWEITQLRRVK